VVNTRIHERGPQRLRISDLGISHLRARSAPAAAFDLSQHGPNRMPRIQQCTRRGAPDLSCHAVIANQSVTMEQQQCLRGRLIGRPLSPLKCEA
jgi:hypothetical protein